MLQTCLAKRGLLPEEEARGDEAELAMTSEPFDVVFTSYGTITWLPDLKPWAKVVAESLKSGGQFTIVEFHPMMWSLDDDFNTFGYDYFNRQANVEIRKGTYADPEADIEGGTGDGLTNFEEFAYGTDPNVNDNVVLTVTDPSTFSPGAPTVEVTFSPLSISASQNS